MPEKILTDLDVTVAKTNSLLRTVSVTCPSKSVAQMRLGGLRALLVKAEGMDDNAVVHIDREGIWKPDSRPDRLYFRRIVVEQVDKA